MTIVSFCTSTGYVVHLNPVLCGHFAGLIKILPLLAIHKILSMFNVLLELCCNFGNFLDCIFRQQSLEVSPLRNNRMIQRKFLMGFIPTSRLFTTKVRLNCCTFVVFELCRFTVELSTRLHFQGYFSSLLQQTFKASAVLFCYFLRYLGLRCK